MSSQKVWAFAALLAATTGAGAQTPDCHLALRGRIEEADTHEPLAYANVYVREAGRGAATDENGFYSIADLCEGTTYTIEVSHIECAHETRLVKLTENATVDFHLVHSAELKEVIVTEKAAAPKPMQAEITVSHADLEAAKGVNLGEAVKKLPGVTTLNTGATIAKPVIQGLHSNRIAIVSGGTAIEGQQWGSEHAPEIDPFAADKISVVKGAAAVRYGTGALAGAVVLEPAPLREKPGIGGWLALGGFSNGWGGVASGAADWHLPHKSLTFRLQGTLKHAGNLRASDYFLGNTGNAERNISGIAGWKSGRRQHQISASQFNQKLGVLRASHIGNTTDLEKAIQSDVPLNNRDEFTWRIGRPYQQIQHNLLKYRLVNRLSQTWKLTGDYAFQFNNRREYDAHAPLSDPQDLLRKPQISFRIWTNEANAAVEHFPIRHWQGAAGVQFKQQLNYVSKGGFIPDYLALGGGIWATERWRRYPTPWEFEVGARYDYRWNHVTDTVGSLRKLNEKVVFHNFSGTAGAIYHFSEHWSATLHTGLATRPPHVNELFARGVHHASATYEEGDPGLVPERAWNTSLTAERKGRPLEAQVTIYRNQIRDFIYLNPRLEPVLTVRGAFPAYDYRSANAVLQGLDGQATWFFARKWAAEGRVSLLRGFRLLRDSASENTHRDWLPLMPTDRFSYGLRWTLDDGRRVRHEGDVGETFVRVMATTALRQSRIPSEGLVKAAPPAFTLLALDAAHTVKLFGKNLELGLSVQNLTNTRYREYLNFFRFFADEPGVNVGLRAKMVF